MIRLSDLVRSHEAAAKSTGQKIEDLEARVKEVSDEASSKLEKASSREKVNMSSIISKSIIILLMTIAVEIKEERW